MNPSLETLVAGVCPNGVDKPDCARMSMLHPFLCSQLVVLGSSKTICIATAEVSDMISGCPCVSAFSLVLTCINTDDGMSYTFSHFAISSVSSRGVLKNMEDTVETL